MEIKIMKHDRFGSVRTITLDGVKYFVGRDVAIALGYRKPNEFISKHVSKDDKKRMPCRSLSSATVTPTIIINSHGLTDLCHAAFSVDATEIEKWLLGVEEPVVQPLFDDKPADKSEEKTAQVLQLLDIPEFGQMRWIIIDGEIWFVVADLCRILGHTNPSMIIASLDDDEKQVIPEIDVTKCNKDSLGSVNTPFFHEINIVNEFGLYRLIMASRKPNAKKFQRKVYHEILPSIHKHGYYISEQAAQGSLFPDEEPIKEKKAIRRPLAEVAVVYVILLSSGLVKIGYTSDFNRRLKEIRKETKLDIIDFFTTNFMSLDEARKLESTIKAKFFDYVVSGEFFNVPFETVKAALNGNPKIEKLLAMADRLTNPDAKDNLVLQAAALLM